MTEPIRFKDPTDELMKHAKAALKALPAEIDAGVLANVAGAIICAYAGNRAEAMTLLQITAGHVIANAYPEEDGNQCTPRPI